VFITRVKGFVYGMNWHFRFRNHPLSPATTPDNCSPIRPLLSLMSDGMASAKEVREAQAHLQICGDCRQALLWIEATRQAIATRPVVLPPADMRARIARAIAASAETAVPAVPVAMPAVRRKFAVRPAYAAAASVALAGAFLGHYLLTSGHAPGSPVLVSPTRTASSGQGQAGTDATPKPGRKSTMPAPVSRKQPLVAATVPSGVAERQSGGKSAPPRQPNSSFATGPQLTAELPAPSASSGPEVKHQSVQVAARPRPSFAPVPDAAKRHSNVIATRPAAKSPAGVHTHVSNTRPLVATLPPPSAAPSATPGSVLATSTPTPAPAPAPMTVVARLPETAPAPSRAASGDALGSIRTSLASYRSEGYARHLSMASGVHLRQNFVQISAVWTPTSLSQTTASRRTAVSASRPATMQAAPETATLTPVSEITSSNQRRSERDKQWSDAPANGGA